MACDTRPGLVGGPEIDPVRILELLEGHVGLGQSEFVSLVEADRAAQAAEQDGEELRGIGVTSAVGPPTGDALYVVVADGETAPAVADLARDGIHGS